MRAIIEDITNIFRTDPWIESRRSLAAGKGWKFRQRSIFSGDPPDLLFFSVFKGKGAKRLMSVMKAKQEDGGRFRIYDLVRYGDFSKKSLTVFEFNHSGLTFPSFTISPKRKMSRIKDMFVTTDLMMPTTPDFNARYAIQTSDAKALKEDINIEFLDLVGDEPGWKYEGMGKFLVAYVPGKVLPPEDIEAQARRFVEMCRALTANLT